MPYPEIPSMPECTGCGDCCGPVTATTNELRKLRRYVRDFNVEWVEHDDASKCGFLRPDNEGSSQCAVYAARPFACRIYGVNVRMPCSFFPEASRIDIPASESVRMGWMDVTDRPIAITFAPDGGVRQREATRKQINDLSKRDDASEILWEGKFRDDATRGMSKRQMRKLDTELEPQDDYQQGESHL